MTWITDLKYELERKYNITPKVSENFKQRYKKYHRACFRFDNSDTEIEFSRFMLYSPKDIPKSTRLKKYISTLPDVVIRSEWTDEFVYFDNLTHLLNDMPLEFLDHIHSLEVMNPLLINSSTQTDDYQNEIAFCTKLPFDKYRYQVYIVTSANERNKIGHDNLLHLRLSIEAYNGIKVNDTFTKSHKHRWWVPETYFYAETLDWLPLIRLMEPRYIRKIKQYKTLEEVQNENST